MLHGVLVRGMLVKVLQPILSSSGRGKGSSGLQHLPWCKYSHCDPFQATDLSLNVELVNSMIGC